MVTDHDMRMEALRLFEENEKLKKALEKVKYALCKDSFCDAEKIESAVKVAHDALTICQHSSNEDPSGQCREPMSPHPLDDLKPF